MSLFTPCCAQLVYLATKLLARERFGVAFYTNCPQDGVFGDNLQVDDCGQSVLWRCWNDYCGWGVKTLVGEGSLTLNDMFSSVEELRAAIRGTEDPELIEKTDEIIAASRPAVGFLPAGDGADAPLGASRVFGLPDVPQGFEWPTGHDGEPLFFLLQIDLGSLSELPLDTLSPEDPLRYLPQEGHMLLFGGSGRHEKCDAHAVKFLPPGQILVRTSMPEEVEEPDFIASDGEDALFKHGVLIEPEFGWDIPRWATEIYFEIVGEYGDLDDVYEELEMEGGSAFDLVRLGGCHSGTRCDPAEDAAEFLEATAPVSPAPTWHHLVTLDSDDGLGLCICDAGCFQVLVHSGDTKFAHTYASTESS